MTEQSFKQFERLIIIVPIKSFAFLKLRRFIISLESKARSKRHDDSARPISYRTNSRIVLSFSMFVPSHASSINSLLSSNIDAWILYQWPLNVIPTIVVIASSIIILDRLRVTRNSNKILTILGNPAEIGIFCE